MMKNYLKLSLFLILLISQTKTAVFKDNIDFYDKQLGILDIIPSPLTISRLKVETTFKLDSRGEPYAEDHTIRNNNSFANNGDLHVELYKRKTSFWAVKGNDPVFADLEAFVFNTDQWYDVVYEYDATAKTVKLFVDGNLELTENYITAHPLILDTGYYGACPTSCPGVQRILQGQIKGVRFTNMDTNEVLTQLYPRCDGISDPNYFQAHEDYWAVNNPVCQECAYQCGTCETQSDNCLTCSDLINRQLAVNECKTCKDGTFDNNTAQCQFCDIKCSKCVSASTNCLECSNKGKRTPDCSVCVEENREGDNCDCKPGFYDDGVQVFCQKCLYKCETCLNINSCSTCKAGSERNLQAPECGCKPGFFEIQNVLDCFQCQEKCLTCESIDQCLVCKDDSLLPPNCEKSKEGNYTEMVSGVYVDYPCSPKCQSCVNAKDNCQVCQGDNRTSSAPDCACESGFSDNLGLLKDCIPLVCPSICSECISETECTGCVEGYELQENQCVCASGYENIQGICKKICKKNEYVDDQNVCQKCYFYQGLCLAQCPKHTNQDGYECKDSGSLVILIVIGIVLILFIGGISLIYCFLKYQRQQKFAQEFQELKREEQYHQQQSQQQMNQDESQL